MISNVCFEEEHIRMLQKNSHKDPVLIERVIYAFGLLEALVKVKMPFVFKGGTCLMLLLKEPRRLSTDIDIVVDPKINIDEYIEKASVIFPIVSVEEQFRIGKNGIIKRHFKFCYDSPINERPFYILLDVLFENNHYQNLIFKEIKMDMLICKGKPYFVKIPSVDCILGDKLTAFAPNTTGIRLGIGKNMEVMKQMYDITSLIEEFSSFDDLVSTYFDVCKTEIAYRGVKCKIEDCLIDTFNAALCIASKGKTNPNDYSLYVKGIRELHGHIFSENYSSEIAAIRAPKIMYLVMCILMSTEYLSVSDYTKYVKMQIENEEMISLKYLKKMNPISYAYVIKTDELLSMKKQGL